MRRGKGGEGSEEGVRAVGVRLNMRVQARPRETGGEELGEEWRGFFGLFFFLCEK